MEAHEILFIVLAVLGLLFGATFWRKFDTAVKLLAELAELLQAVSELMATTSEALKNRKVTKSEAVLLLKKWQTVTDEFTDVYNVLRVLLPASAIKFLFRR